MLDETVTVPRLFAGTPGTNWLTNFAVELLGCSVTDPVALALVTLMVYVTVWSESLAMARPNCEPPRSSATVTTLDPGGDENTVASDAFVPSGR